MNLAYRDIRHNVMRFVLTCFGLSLLLGIVLGSASSNVPSIQANTTSPTVSQ